MTVTEIGERETRFVIGVDPGTTTGIVVWDNLDRSVIVQDALKPEEALSFLSHLVMSLARNGTPPVIVIERLDISMDTVRKSREGINDLIHVLGATWALALGYELGYFELGRSDTKNFVKDEALKRHSLWLKSRHARDALRVVFTWLAKTDHDFVRNFWVN